MNGSTKSHEVIEEYNRNHTKLNKKLDIPDNTEGLNSEYIKVVEDLYEASVFLKKFKNSDSIIEGISAREKVFEKYEELMNTQTLLKVKVSDADNSGNLHIPISLGINGIVKNEDVLGGETYNIRKRSVHVGTSFLAVVKQVDRDSSTIYFSRAMAKDAYQKLLRETLKEGMQVNARVRHVDSLNKRIYIDVEGCNLWGYIPINAWSHGFVYKPAETIKKNTIVSVIIKKHLLTSGNRKEVFICSRKDAILNPWDNIEKRFTRNSIVLVECVDLQPTKFFARIPDMPDFDLDVYCEYPDNDKKSEIEKIIIKLGHKYKVRVYDVSEADRKLKARVLSEFIASSSSDKTTF